MYPTLGTPICKTSTWEMIPQNVWLWRTRLMPHKTRGAVVNWGAALSGRGMQTHSGPGTEGAPLKGAQTLPERGWWAPFKVLVGAARPAGIRSRDGGWRAPSSCSFSLSTSLRPESNAWIFFFFNLSFSLFYFLFSFSFFPQRMPSWHSHSASLLPVGAISLLSLSTSIAQRGASTHIYCPGLVTRFLQLPLTGTVSSSFPVRLAFLSPMGS